MNNRMFGLVGLFALAVGSGPAAASEDPKVLTNRAVGLARRGRWAEAVQPLRRAARRDPALALAHHDLGVVLVQQGSYDEALASLQRALELEDLAETHEALGLALLYLDRNEEAVAEYEVARRRGRSSAPTLFNLGLALERLGRLAEAEQAYRGALAADAAFAAARAAIVRVARQVVAGDLGR